MLEEEINKLSDNVKFFNGLSNRLDVAILDMQVNLGKKDAMAAAEAAESSEALRSQEEITQQILQQQNSAAGILSQVKTRHALLASNLSFNKDVIGVVANLASVDNRKLSRLLSEYLGLETMLGIVCKTYEGVKALESYDAQGKLNTNFGLHGLASSIGRTINGRFLIICLENLLTYVGNFVAKDPQKKLDIPNPKLPNGECPSGFLGFAVNMINIENKYLHFVGNTAHGLRETLFYHLFSRLQVYNSRTEMLHALPCITHGALSLDGAMVRAKGIFVIGDRKDVAVNFPVVPAFCNPCIDSEDKIRMLKCEKLNIAADIRRTQSLLDKKLKFIPKREA